MHNNLDDRISKFLLYIFGCISFNFRKNIIHIYLLLIKIGVPNFQLLKQKNAFIDYVRGIMSHEN